MEHIITAVFDPGKIRTVASEPLFQWDYGQTLVFSGIELPTAYQVDFSNFEYCGNSIPQIGGADGVTVPVDVLITGRDVYAFVWLQDADSGRTRYMAQIPVIPRPVPDLDDPNPEQESAIAEAIAALNAGVAAAEAAQAAAEQSAEDAAESAQEAAGSASAAAGSASEAGSARDAAQAAQAAAEAAQTAAEQSAEDAAESAQDAAGSAAAAAGSASETGSAVQAAEAAQAAAEAAEEAAVQSAENSAESAQEAAGSAAAAAGSASEAGSAVQAAEIAQGKAEDAQEAAETAQGAAEAAAASVAASTAQIAKNTADIASLEEDRYKAYATDTASGAIASFPDGADDIPVKDLTVAVDPVQDLHGYENPWPDGGGINLVDKVSNESYGGTVSADGLAVTSKVVTASGNSNFMRAVFSNPFDAVTSETLYVSVDVRLLAGTMDSFAIQLVGGSNFTSIGISKYNNVPSTAKQRISFSGSSNRDDPVRGIYIQAKNADGAQLEISNIQISKIEDYNYHPYSNICPISGWTSATVTRAGKNLLPKFSNGTSNGVTATVNDDGSVALSGTATGNASFSVSLDNAIVNSLRGKTVTFSGIATSTIFVQMRVGVNGSYTYPTTQTGARTIRIPVDCDSLRVDVRVENGAATGVTVYPQLELGSTATDYKPYSGNTYNIQIGDTVYRGTLDVATGKLTVEMVIADAGELTWGKQSSEAAGIQFYTNTLTGIKTSTGGVYVQNIKCNKYKTISWNDYVGYDPPIDCVITQTVKQVRIRDSAYNDFDTTEFKNAVAGTKILYELESPVVYNLTPVQVVKTLHGINNIWSNTGTVSVSYRADLSLLLDELNIGKSLYFAEDGSDENLGTPASPKKDFSAFLNSGYSLYFKSGNTFYLPDSVLASTDQKVYRLTNGTKIFSYGGVERPRISGLVKTSATFSLVSGNIYSAPVSGRVGILVIDGKRMWARVFSESLSADGEWYYDYDNSRVLVYSSTSLAGKTFAYTYGGTAFSISGGSGSTIDGIEVEDWGVHGIQVSNGAANVVLSNNRIHDIGGGTLSIDGSPPSGDPVRRLGNGIEIWCDNLSDIIVKNNEVYNCYDAGITPQISTGSSSSGPSNGIVFKQNFVHECNYLFEIFCGGKEIHVLVKDNLLMNPSDITNGYRDSSAFQQSILRISTMNNADGSVSFSGNTGIGAGNGYVIFNYNNLDQYKSSITFDDIYASDGETKISYPNAFPYTVDTILDVPATPVADKDFAVLGYYLALAKIKLVD